MVGLTTNNQGLAQGWSPNAQGPGGATPQTNEYWTDTGAVRGPITQAESHTLAARSMSIIADPQPLGLAGFAAATFTISTVVAGWHGFAALAVAAPIAIFFGGIAQFLAGMWAFRRGSTLAATAFSTFGAFNVAFGVLLLLAGGRSIPAVAGGTNAGYVAGWFILTFGVIAGYLAIAALAENWVLVAILVTLSATYTFDGLGTMIVGPNNWATYIGGYCGIVSSLLAFYLSAALVINASFKREVAPLFSTRGPSASITKPSTGVLGDQMARR
ncbi:MAG TPA: acetate uptake transporter [Ktedonobacterales bacterium]|jgi:hypothetical protein